MIKLIPILISVAALGFVLYIIFSKNQRPWNQMTEEEQKRKKVMFAGGLSVFIAGMLAAIFLGRKK
jgi:Na+/H+ antiporter NhaD/arsenite permease-like protein